MTVTLTRMNFGKLEIDDGAYGKTKEIVSGWRWRCDDCATAGVALTREWAQRDACDHIVDHANARVIGKWKELAS